MKWKKRLVTFYRNCWRRKKILFIICFTVFIFPQGSNVFAKTLDKTLEMFLEENLKENSVLIESETTEEYGQANIFLHENTRWAEGIEGKVYTYAAEEKGRMKYQTVWDLFTTREVKVSKDDFAYLGINNFLLYYSPIKGELWIKNKEEEEWNYSRDITPLFTIDGVTVFGSEMKSDSKYFRILIYFCADMNEGSAEKMPVYRSTYTNVVGKNVNVKTGIGGCVLLGIILICMIRFKKRC